MNKSRSYVCNECSRGFKSSRALKVHRRHHGSVGEILNAATQRPSLPSHPEYGGEGGQQGPGPGEHYICTVCGENLQSFTAMKSHQHTAGSGQGRVPQAAPGQATAPDTLGYKCPSCPKRFKYSSSLSRHQRSGKCGWQGCSTPARRCADPATEKIEPGGGGSSGPGGGGSSGPGGGGSVQAPTLRRSQRRRPARAEPLRCTECQRQFKEVDQLHEHYMWHARGAL